MRKLIVLLLVLMTVVTGAGAAFAHVTDYKVILGIVRHDPEFERVTVIGEITCTAGETWSFRINVFQEGGRAVGRASGECSGDGDVDWVARARVVEGSFTDGPAAYRAQGRTSDGGTFSDSGFFDIAVCEEFPSCFF